MEFHSGTWYQSSLQMFGWWFNDSHHEQTGMHEISFSIRCDTSMRSQYLMRSIQMLRRPYPVGHDHTGVKPARLFPEPVSWIPSQCPAILFLISMNPSISITKANNPVLLLDWLIGHWKAYLRSLKLTCLTYSILFPTIHNRLISRGISLKHTYTHASMLRDQQ